MGVVLSGGWWTEHGYGVMGSALTWLAYNRDSYADNVAMRQNQLYQRRNYHLSWVTVAREDIRDIMQTAVAKTNNYMVITTLVLGFAVGMACDVDLTDSPYHFQVLFYMCVTASLIYMAISIVFGMISANAAFTYSVELLSRKVRPDATDAYDEEFDYMKQTQQFEKSIWQVFRVPVVKPLYNRHVKGQGPKLEYLDVGGELAKTRNRNWKDLPDKQGDPQKLTDKAHKTWYFDAFNKYAMLWRPYEIGSFNALRFGGLHLAYVATYLNLSVLAVQNDKNLLGSTLSALWIVALALAFTATYPQIRESLSVDFAPNVEESTTKDMTVDHTFGNKSLYLMLVATFLPPTIVWLLHVFKAPMENFEGPLIFASHLMATLLHILRLSFQHVNFGEAFQTQPETKKDREQSFDRLDSMRPTSLGSSRSHSSAGAAESASNLEKPKCNSKVHGEIHDDVDFDMSADKLTAESIKDGDDNDDDTVLHTEQVVNKLRESIIHTFKAAKYGLISVHIVVATGWFCFLLMAIFFPSGGDERDVLRPKLVTQATDVQLEWPSEFFQPKAMACAKEDVFIADEFHVYRMKRGKLSALPCDLSEAIVDISAVCNTRSCWPVVLTASNSATLVNCLAGEACRMQPDDNSSCSTWAATGECANNPGYMRSHCQMSCQLCDGMVIQHKAMNFSHTKRVEHVSARDSSLTGSIYALRSENPPKVVEYRLAQKRPILEPWWSVADVEITGLRSVDVASQRLFFFSNSPSGGKTDAGRVESRMLTKNSAISHAWMLPKELPPLIAGCVPHLSDDSAAHPSGASALVLLGSQDDEQPPRLVNIDLPY